MSNEVASSAPEHKPLDAPLPAAPSGARPTGPGDGGPAPAAGRTKRRMGWKWGLLLAVLAAAVAWQVRSAATEGDARDATLLFQKVRRQALSVTVIERGNLESQSDVPVMCEVDDFRRDGFNGTPIVWVIPNGTVVEKGQLIVELDPAPVQEQVDEQILETEQARELMLLAEARYENQKSQNKTNLADAQLAVRLAELEMEMFSDQERGTHRLEVEELRRAVDDLNNEILASEANLELKRNDKDGIETLFKQGYAGKSEYERSQLEFLKAESQYTSNVNKLKTQLATLKNKETYELQKQMLDLNGRLETARRALEQVELNNAAQLTQLKASMEARREQLKKEEELLQRYRDQLAACKVYAPEAGMVAYANSRYDDIAPGTYVRLRQKILTLPDLTKMQVRTAVHESVLDQVERGQEVTVKIDAFADREYQGTVESVGVLPQQSNSSTGADTRFYETVVRIEGQVQQLKPGMTAVVEIHIDHIDDALVVPLQAVTEIDGQAYCFVSRGGGIERVPLELGVANEHSVQVLSGIRQGEEVVINPFALLDEQPDEEGDEPTEDESTEDESTEDEENEPEITTPERESPAKAPSPAASDPSAAR